uniref:Aldose reductase n=1 Tax=Lygus hesperus TaxID=30085 RepID=A0A0A9W9J7_LYGHE
MPASKIPSVKLNSGFEIPIFGLGTWKSKPGEVGAAVKDAIDAGYRHFDCAHIYGNEKEIGTALQDKIQDGTVTREELFITSKLWNTFHRKDLVRGAIETTLSNLQLDYIDLYLIHWPMGYKEDVELFPRDANGKVQYSDVDYVDTWKEIEAACRDGKIRSIGLSNFNKNQIQRVIGVADIKPAVLQVECHPYLPQKKLIEFCKSQEIAVTAYSPLGSPDRPMAKPGDPELLKEPVLATIADQYGKGVGHVLIRYQIQRGVIVIPKSTNKSRIQSNIEVFDFTLSDDDMKTLNGLDKGVNGRMVALKDISDHPHYPFTAEF